MKKTLILAVLVAALAGCQQSSSSGGETATPVAPVPASGAAQNLVRFEIRDFKLDEQKKSYGTEINGRGTLVTKDDALKKGNYVVWLSVKQAHKNDERAKYLIVLRDGIGTIETFDILNREDGEKKKIKYFDWEIIGFVKLQEGVISLDEPIAVK